MYQLSYTLPESPNKWMYKKVSAKDEDSARKQLPEGVTRSLVIRVPTLKEFKRYIYE